METHMNTQRYFEDSIPVRDALALDVMAAGKYILSELQSDKLPFGGVKLTYLFDRSAVTLIEALQVFYHYITRVGQVSAIETGMPFYLETTDRAITISQPFAEHLHRYEVVFRQNEFWESV